MVNGYIITLIIHGARRLDMLYETYWIKQAKESVKLVGRNRAERRRQGGSKSASKKSISRPVQESKRQVEILQRASKKHNAWLPRARKCIKKTFKN